MSITPACIRLLLNRSVILQPIELLSLSHIPDENFISLLGCHWLTCEYFISNQDLRRDHSLLLWHMKDNANSDRRHQVRLSRSWGHCQGRERNHTE